MPLLKITSACSTKRHSIVAESMCGLKMKAEEQLIGDNIAFEDDGSVDEQDDVAKVIDKNTVLMVSFEMLDFDLHSSTRYAARVVSVRLRQLHLIFTLNTGLVDYFPRITQSIKGINKKAWQFISMIYKIITPNTMNLRDIPSPRCG